MLLDGDDELNNNQMQKDRDYIPLWYIMDEVGSRVNHDDEPNFAFKPFYFLQTDTTFTVVFPLQDLEYGGMYLVCFSMFVENIVPLWPYHPK